MNLTSLDLAVILIPLGAVFVVALLMARQMKGVAGFLAADRCAGRYLISTASSEAGASVIVLLSVLEVFSRAGLSLRFWFSITETALFLLGLLGVVVYRFRQTRSLTFHQFFERRYSKGIRVFSSLLSVLSGILAFGLAPAVGARFFVYFCGMPPYLNVGGLEVQTFAMVMVVLMGISLFFALTGGQISIMVTDCLEGVISTFFYIVIGVFVITTISVSQMRDVLTSGPPGASYVDPFDIAGRGDFNGWYVVFGLILWLYQFRGTAWTQGFAAAARSAHESRMASILSSWRSYCTVAMTLLVGIAAFTVLNHPDYAAKQQAVQSSLANIGSDQLRTQMRMPTALGELFVPGIKGALCAVLLFGLIASQGSALHGHGSTILQDIVLPLRRKPMTPDGHVLALRLTIGAVALFVCVFSYFFEPVDYLVMLGLLIGAIYIGGIGAVVWGGLYWRRGTTAGAWSAMIAGAGLGIGFNLLTQTWSHLAPALSRLAGPGPITDYLVTHAEKFPLNGQILSLITVTVAAGLYVIVSLLSRKPLFDLKAMLHNDEAQAVSAFEGRSWLDRMLNINADFTPGDRRLTKFTFCWTIGLKLFAVGVLFWVLLIARPSETFWFNYTMVMGVWLSVAVGLVVTVWFTFGVTKDLYALFKLLRQTTSDASDDGTETSFEPQAEAPMAEIMPAGPVPPTPARPRVEPF